MPQTLRAPTEPTSGLAAPVPRIERNGSLRQSLRMASRGQKKMTRKRRKKEEVLIRRKTEGTDRYSTSLSSNPAAKPDKEAIKKERGRGLEKNTVLVTNSSI